MSKLKFSWSVALLGIIQQGSGLVLDSAVYNYNVKVYIFKFFYFLIILTYISIDKNQKNKNCYKIRI